MKTSPQKMQELTWLIMRAADMNGGPDQDEARRELLQYEHSLVEQLLIEFLWDQGTTDTSWGSTVEGITSILMSESYHTIAVSCTPTLASILSLHYDSTQLDPSFILDVFEVLGVQHYPFLIPALIDLIRRNETPYFKEVAWKLLWQFDKEFLKPYQLLINLLPKV